MSDSSTGGTIGCTLLFGILALLKICPWDNPVQDWSWWWVTAPMWAGTAFLLVMAMLAGILVLITKVLDKTLP
ncbi:hypothetical protein [Mycobacteroides abscessus]|uniref:hypothetical protein n=1 Tax=Mycobacteroides abscessus TaxID=36809 RepID=UPI00092736F5|nr:hypothetical protein [Mycobacteroides abscessus]SIL62229.1 Uncharacterised protein [Mycobacteroides abscessus subsp. abscessus]